MVSFAEFDNQLHYLNEMINSGKSTTLTIENIKHTVHWNKVIDRAIEIIQAMGKEDKFAPACTSIIGKLQAIPRTATDGQAIPVSIIDKIRTQIQKISDDYGKLKLALKGLPTRPPSLKRIPSRPSLAASVAAFTDASTPKAPPSPSKPSTSTIDETSPSKTSAVDTKRSTEPPKRSRMERARYKMKEWNEPVFDRVSRKIQTHLNTLTLKFKDLPNELQLLKNLEIEQLQAEQKLVVEKGNIDDMRAFKGKLKALNHLDAQTVAFYHGTRSQSEVDAILTKGSHLIRDKKFYVLTWDKERGTLLLSWYHPPIRPSTPMSKNAGSGSLKNLREEAAAEKTGNKSEKAHDVFFESWVKFDKKGKLYTFYELNTILVESFANYLGTAFKDYEALTVARLEPRRKSK